MLKKLDFSISRQLFYLLTVKLGLKVNGIFVAMKGNLNEELNGIENYENKLKIKQNKRIDFQLPIEKSNRTLISFIKLEMTDIKYPRKYSEIKKKSL